MLARRVHVFMNSQKKDGKVIALPSGVQMSEFMDSISQHLGISCKKLYFPGGAEVDDLQLIRDDDTLIASEEDAFTHYRICILGAGAVGKSSLTLRYVRGEFVDYYDPTIEDAYRANFALDGEYGIVDVLDTAGQEDYRMLHETWIRNRDGFLLVCDLTQKSSLSRVEEFIATIKHTFDGEAVPPYLIIGNKCDLEESEISIERGEEFAELQGAVGFVQTSAKTGHNVALAFEKLLGVIHSKHSSKKRKITTSSWCPFL